MWRVINQGKNLWDVNKLYNAYFSWSQGLLTHSSTAVVSFNPLIIKEKATYSGAGMALAIPDGVTNINIAATNIGDNHFYLRVTFRKDFELCFASPTGSGQFPYNFIKVEPGERKLLSAAIPDGYRYAVVSIDSDLGIGTLLYPADVVVGFDLKTDEYVPSLQQSLESSIDLWNYNGVYDEITSDGLVVKRWTKINIDWTNWATTSFKGRVSDDSGWQVVLNRLTSQVAKRMSEIVAVKYDGVPLKYVGDETETSSKDQVAWGSQEYYYVVSISDADSGWNSSYEPSSEDIKRYFNGWKYVDGTTWQGIGSSATADADTALNYTVKDIDPDADWKPYVVIYQLAEPEYYQVLVNGELYVAPGTNYIILPNNAFAVVELETDTQKALDSIFAR